MNAKNVTLKELIQQNKTASVEGCTFCRKEHCRDCAYMEMDNDFWNDGTRRCAYKGTWLKPSSEACWKFTP